MTDYQPGPNPHCQPAPKICDCTTECLYPDRHPRRLPADCYPRQSSGREDRKDYGGLFGLALLAGLVLGVLDWLARWAGS